MELKFCWWLQLYFMTRWILWNVNDDIQLHVKQFLIFLYTCHRFGTVGKLCTCNFNHMWLTVNWNYFGEIHQQKFSNKNYFPFFHHDTPHSSFSLVFFDGKKNSLQIWRSLKISACCLCLYAKTTAIQWNIWLMITINSPKRCKAILFRHKFLINEIISLHCFLIPTSHYISSNGVIFQSILIFE